MVTPVKKNSTKVYWLVSWRYVRLPGHRHESRVWTIFPILGVYACRLRFQAWTRGNYGVAMQLKEKYELRARYPENALVTNPDAWY